MKKLLKVALIMLAFAVAVPVVSAQNYGLTEKEMKANKKEAEKQAKKKAKELKKQKWIYPGANTLENELTNFLMATTFSNGNRESMEEPANNVSSIRRGESIARSAAENDFAREIQVAIAGKIVEVFGNASGEDIEKQSEEWAKRVAQELNGDIKRHFYLYRQNPDKTFDVLVYFSRPANDSSTIQNKIDSNLDLIEKVFKSTEK